MSAGSYARNPVNQEAVPVWVADYVLGSYGSGAIMAVPAHDSRDYDFARQFDLPVRQVVQPHAPSQEPPLPFTGHLPHCPSPSRPIHFWGNPVVLLTRTEGQLPHVCISAMAIGPGCSAL